MPCFFKNTFMLQLKNISFFILIIFFFGCDIEPDKNNTGDGFDRSSLLTNLTDNIIIPAYNSFYNDLSDLENKISEFILLTNESNLQSVSDSWLVAYKSWQHIEMFDIGLSETINFKAKINIYPVDTSLIESNILSANYDLGNNNNFDARGFPALDYMIHGIALNSSLILAKYVDDINYKNYLLAIVEEMKLKTNLMIEDWNTSRDAFVQSTENTATSSVNKLINDFIYYYEKGFRANKFGIPAGVFSNASILPYNVEAYFKADVSKELALESFNAIKSFYLGKHFDSQEIGIGFADYLNYLYDISSSDNDLDLIITNKFIEIESKINSLDDNFNYQITSNNMDMLLTYDLIQELVVKFKVDVLQAFNIAVDYIDADGD